MGTRARAAAVLATILALVAQLALPLIAYAEATNTAAAANGLERITSAAEQLANWLKTIAYIVLVIGAFIGVLNYVFGKGPEWLARVAGAAIILSVVLWIIGQVFPK